MYPSCTRNGTVQDGAFQDWGSATCKEEFCFYYSSSSSSSSYSSSSLASFSKTSHLPVCFSVSPNFWFRPLLSRQCFAPSLVFPTCFAWFPTCFAWSFWQQRWEGTQWATLGVWWATFGMLQWTMVCHRLTLATPKMRRQRLPQGLLWPTSLADVAVFPFNSTSVGAIRWGPSEGGAVRASFK